VTKAEALRLALVEGIGPAKAFGCGLLSVARG
jgi:CRISPR system Cascade subunit CasE